MGKERERERVQSAIVVARSEGSASLLFVGLAIVCSDEHDAGRMFARTQNSELPANCPICRAHQLTLFAPLKCNISLASMRISK